MSYLPNILFLLLLTAAIVFFVRNVNKLSRNIKLGKDVDRSDNKPQRINNLIRIALGQSKMVKRPVSGILHIIVYLGFIIINIEVLEILIDGIFGTHRVLSFMGGFYDFIIAAFEVLALLVLISVIVFWIRRNITRIKRFWNPEMKGWPKNDANIILYFEMVLMALFLTMNAADYQLQQMGVAHYAEVGSFPVSQYIAPLFENMSASALIAVERSAWWLHIIGIFIFLNYLYYSKHLHILLAFPNTYYAKLDL